MMPPRIGQRHLADMIVPALPVLSVLLAIVAMALPLPLAWGVLPQLPLLLVLVWASLAPHLLPVYAALLLGIVADLVTGVPLGINAFLLPLGLVAVRIAESRTEVRSLFLDWVFTALVVLVASLVGWQMLAFAGHPAPIGPVLAQAALTIIAWPLVVRVALHFRRRMLEA